MDTGSGCGRKYDTIAASHLDLPILTGTQFSIAGGSLTGGRRRHNQGGSSPQPAGSWLQKITGEETCHRRGQATSAWKPTIAMRGDRELHSAVKNLLLGRRTIVGRIIGYKSIPAIILRNRRAIASAGRQSGRREGSLTTDIHGEPWLIC